MAALVDGQRAGADEFKYSRSSHHSLRQSARGKLLDSDHREKNLIKWPSSMSHKGRYKTSKPTAGDMLTEAEIQNLMHSVARAAAPETTGKLYRHANGPPVG